MKPTISEKLIAYLALISGLSISAVAVYYSVIGLTSIFAAAAIPIIIMGVALEVSKLVATVWLKQNWTTAPRMIKSYLMIAVVVLMLITSMGIFGFLSKAHLDQSVPTGDVIDRVALIDEKIKTQRENIDAARRALKQMDESVDQVMARSSDERGADKAAALRRAQQRERAVLQRDISNAQSIIATLNEERAPIAKELRKVEAEVGPIKYIASFVYGETDQIVLEKAVTWVIISLIIVFDPLAVILLLAAQTSFQQFRTREAELLAAPLPYVADVGEKPTEEEKAEIEAEGDSPVGPEPVIDDQKPTVAETTASIFEQHPYLQQGFKYPEGWERVPPLVAPIEVSWPTEWKQPETEVATTASSIQEIVEPQPDVQKIVDLVKSIVESPPEPAPEIKPPTPIKTTEGRMFKTKVFPRPNAPVVEETPAEPVGETYVQNEEQKESNLWSTATENVINSEDYIKMAQAKREEEIQNYAAKVRSKEIQMSEVPEEYQSLVKSMV